MSNYIRRLKAKWWLLRHIEDSYQRRTQVEGYLRDCARGKRPPPNAQECREWSLILGIPTEVRDAQAETPQD